MELSSWSQYIVAPVSSAAGLAPYRISLNKNNYHLKFAWDVKGDKYSPQMSVPLEAIRGNHVHPEGPITLGLISPP